ncbi:hypothetical protein JCM10207_009265 [Rhodosporidiobolus poonsookiae]
MSSPSSPLLGTPYLLSQSPSSTSPASPASPTSPSHTPITPALCADLLRFHRLLDTSRRLSDDVLSTRLNRAAALGGAAVGGRGAREMGSGECAAVWGEMTSRWGERNEALRYCDRVLRGERVAGQDNVREESGLSADKGDLSRGRQREDEVKLAALSTTLSVEYIIRQRSLALFFSRCPSSPSSSYPAAADTPEARAAAELPILGDPAERAREEERRRQARGRDERGNVRWT